MEVDQAVKNAGINPNLDWGLLSIVHVARHHEISTDITTLRQSTPHNGGRFSKEELTLAARSVGLKAKIVRLTKSRLADLPLPALVIANDGMHQILVSRHNELTTLAPPYTASGRVSEPDLLRISSGHAIIFSSQASLIGEAKKFDITWFIPSIVKYRRILSEVLVTSFVLQLFGLVSPMMMQVIMDKVLVNHAANTLKIISIALLVSAIFEVLLTGFRNYLFTHTTNRIDVELGSKLFKHLVELPVRYFSTRRVGDTVARVKELESIRNFLTGQALTATIDIVFSVVFLAVMCSYSTKLTLVVLLSMPVYLIISLGIIPILRTRLQQKFFAGANQQAFLVETVSGAETVKSMAMEPQFQYRWNKLLAQYVNTSFRVANFANLGQQSIQLVGKISAVLILYIGASEIFEARLTIGQLVAFNMLSQYITMPILRLAGLWQEFQQVGISIDRMADLLNTKTERHKSTHTAPMQSGAVSFVNVSFRYSDDRPNVLSDISLEIPTATVLGIVGKSGSGKSTLTKILQKFYRPDSGKVFVDGTDLSLIDPGWLRSNVGVVLQENKLFNCSIRENIAIANVGMEFERIVKASSLAGAHEFIKDLPEGYETILAENGANLSGGQRQRIAIARALVSDPKLLIFDEATSALDFESESIIHANMEAISQGRTVIIIAHRLSAVRNCDNIIVLDEGRIIDQGNHDEMILRPGKYRDMREHQVSY
ncbi:type I secretion system permease/ATPase [Paucibacter sp. R3-3]|uniref:Type I secretion system permease/ATPase n=1 Tax=Roseateles agri TaxID=3098619 RepID=A0ABU5DE23_9BURK|nr:type I secretion system permease/ATPase [Paucibacter sp. R3-3]MDY0744000.1 type I secretion system permease/ATPase [Paucibacter sp. R3-3]